MTSGVTPEVVAMAALRRILFLLWACLLAAPALAHAQGEPSLFTFGARGGVLFTSWDYTEGDEFFDRGTDYAVGGFVGIGGRGARPLSLGVVVDVLYARQRVADAIIGEDIVRQLVHIPILLKVQAVSLPGDTRLYGLAGPAFDIQTGATFGEEDVADIYEGTVYSFVAGGGVEFGRWSVETRYAWGLKSVVRDLLGPGEIRSNSIAILGGFRLR
jgi:hypothetical protein